MTEYAEYEMPQLKDNGWRDGPRAEPGVRYGQDNALVKKPCNYCPATVALFEIHNLVRNEWIVLCHKCFADWSVTVVVRQTENQRRIFTEIVEQALVSAATAGQKKS